MEIMIICNLHRNIINNIHTVQPPFCWGAGGGGGGGGPPNQKSKRGGGGGEFFQEVGGDFHIKNKLNSEIFNGKISL